MQQTFEQALNQCINSMSQDDARGEIYVFDRVNGSLEMRAIPGPLQQDLEAYDWSQHEMVVFDGGNTHGDAWKHVFFPPKRDHHFVYES